MIPATKIFLKGWPHHCSFQQECCKQTAYVFTFTKCYSHFWIVWVVLSGLCLGEFLSHKKETIHRQSWSKLRQLLHSPGICVYLNQRNSWSAAGLHDACTAHHQQRGVARVSGLFWLMNSVANNSSQYVSMHVHESDLLTSYFCLFPWSLSLSGLSIVITGEFMISFSIQTCAVSFIFWMSQAL